MENILIESGIRDINQLADRYPKAEIYFHQDLDGVVSAIAMREYLEKYGIDVIDTHVIQYGDKEFSVQKPKASGDVMPVLVDFAHGKPIFTIHTDHHDTQIGVEDDTSTQFRGARSNVETISQIVSPQDIFPTDDIMMISTVDSADYARHGLTPDDVMNYIYKFEEDGSLPQNKWLLGLLTNKLLLAYKNKPDFLEELVSSSSPSLLNIFQNINRISGERSFATPEQMKVNQQRYIKSQEDSDKIYLDGEIIVQYGGGQLYKPGSYDRYTPFKLYPEADFLVIAWPLGLVQASCNPFKEERALKGINLGEIAQEVLLEFKEELENYIVPFSVLKRLSEVNVNDESIGFKSTDLEALYGDKIINMPSPQSGFGKMVRSILNIQWPKLSEKQKAILDKLGVSAWDVVTANSGGHKCITNISGLSFYKRGKRNPQRRTYGGNGGDTPYIDLVKRIQSAFVTKLKEKINSGSSLQEVYLVEAMVDDLIQKYPTEENIIQTLNDEAQNIAGSNKYLPWMVKQWMEASPDDRSEDALEEIINATSSFHQALPRINRETITGLIGVNDFPSVSTYTRIVGSPKDIHAYPNAEVLRDISMQILSDLSRGDKEKFAKSGAEKLYEDDRWLLVKPKTKEASCYYGAGTQWCTSATKGNAFGQYNKNGNLYYLIDKSRKLGPYYKLAIYRSYAGNTDSIHDERDRRLDANQEELLTNILPPQIIALIDEDMTLPPPPTQYYELPEFTKKLTEYVDNLTRPRKFDSESGTWTLRIEDRDDWILESKESGIILQANPFFEGQYYIPVDSWQIEEKINKSWHMEVGYPPLPPYEAFRKRYMEMEDNEDIVNRKLGWVLNLYQKIMQHHVLNDETIQKVVGIDFTTWSANRWANTMTFRYPPKEGSLTQRFVDFVKKNPGKTRKEFYDSIGREYRPGHNSSFFAAIKDSGIVDLTRQGRQFVYTIGPNHQAWTEGRLRLI